MLFPPTPVYLLKSEHLHRSYPEPCHGNQRESGGGTVLSDDIFPSHPLDPFADARSTGGDSTDNLAQSPTPFGFPLLGLITARTLIYRCGPESACDPAAPTAHTAVGNRTQKGVSNEHTNVRQSLNEPNSQGTRPLGLVPQNHPYRLKAAILSSLAKKPREQPRMLAGSSLQVLRRLGRLYILK